MRLSIALALLAGTALCGQDQEPGKSPATTPPAAPADPAAGDKSSGDAADQAQLAKEAKDYAATGMQAMKDADADPHRGVDAALAFSHAMHCYEQLGDVDAVCEMQADIFWCKKRMNLDDLQAYIAKKGPMAQRDFGAAQQVMSKQVPVDQAKDYLDRADKYRAANPDKHFEVAIRYSEIVERFPDTDQAKAATAVFTKEQSAYLAQVSEERKKEQEQLKAELAEARKTRFMSPPTVAAGAQSPIPDKGTQAAALDTVKKAYKDDYTRAKKDYQKRALARKLAAEGEKSKDDSAVYYVMLDESQKLAMDSEDYETLLSDIEHLGASFQGFDQAAAKKAAMKKINKPTAQLILKLLDDPNDKAANATVGKFFCYNIARWDLGLPMLSAGADADLHKVAEMELGNPKDPNEKKQTADAWYEVGKKASGADKVGAWGRAQHWYIEVMPSLSGISKNMTEKRMDEIDTILPPVITDYDNITPKQWDKLKGSVVTVEARVDRSDGHITLSAGERVRVVPHPTDQWHFTGGGWSEDIDVTYKGLVYRHYSSGGSGNSNGGGNGNGNGGGTGSSSSGFSWYGNGKFHDCCMSLKVGDSEEQLPGIVKGPGHLWIMPHNNDGRLGSGTIRVKLVPVADDE
jgi:hypothetical protein